MHVILVTEIWGHTKYVNKMADAFLCNASSVSVVDPYNGTDPGFVNEEEAYSCYLSECGHSEYAKRVSLALSRATAPVCLVGFSAGAGAVWSAVCKKEVDRAQGAICFYGSSIRTMTELVPSIPVDLVFSEHEPNFEVTQVVQALQKHPLTDCHLTPYGHGFMNPLSANYNSNAYQQWLTWIQDRVALYCEKARLLS